MPALDSGGVAIDYDVEGDGPPIVLVHGFASSADTNWRGTGIIKTFVEAGRRVITFDCRGHGKSGKPHDPAAYAGAKMSEDVVALLDHLGVPVADLMGYSMGGGIAAALLVNCPDRFRSVILAGAGDVLLDGGRGREATAIVASALEGGSGMDATARGFRAYLEQTGNDLAALAAMESAPRGGFDPTGLRQTTLPVLILVGDADTIIVSADKLAATIPGAEYVKVVGDHMTAPLTPEFTAAALSFLAKHSPVARVDW